MKRSRLVPDDHAISTLEAGKPGLCHHPLGFAVGRLPAAPALLAQHDEGFEDGFHRPCPVVFEKSLYEEEGSVRWQGVVDLPQDDHALLRYPVVEHVGEE